MARSSAFKDDDMASSSSNTNVMLSVKIKAGQIRKSFRWLIHIETSRPGQPDMARRPTAIDHLIQQCRTVHQSMATSHQQRKQSNQLEDLAGVKSKRLHKSRDLKRSRPR